MFQWIFTHLLTVPLGRLYKQFLNLLFTRMRIAHHNITEVTSKNYIRLYRTHVIRSFIQIIYFLDVLFYFCYVLHSSVILQPDSITLHITLCYNMLINYIQGVIPVTLSVAMRKTRPIIAPRTHWRRKKITSRIFEIFFFFFKFLFKSQAKTQFEKFLYFLNNFCYFIFSLNWKCILLFKICFFPCLTVE